MKAGPLTLSAVSLLALAAGGCSSSPPPEEHASVVAPTTAEATGPAAAVAAEPQVQQTTTYSPAYVVDRDQMRGVLLASNPAVYSNTQLMSRPNLYQDPAAYRAQVASAQASQAMAGGTQPPATRSAEHESRVFFDWDKATLTPEGRRVVGAIAKSANADPSAQIALVGKADLSGTEDYNLKLSQRRADTVRNQLVAEGVAASRIETRWVGDREPPVPTARGVREARNRVVTMTTAMLVGSSAPPAPVILPRQVLFTTTEDSPAGVNGHELPGVQPNGSVSGPTGGS
jgi:outer membrane protein OmpA-like peptidoglycan-associated protein